jgi:hypothetical protein
MLDIIPNHIALIVDGRVSGAMVGDSALAVGSAQPVTVDAAQRASAAHRAARYDSALARAVPGYHRLP